jgi:hypothetical protein
VFLQAKGFMAPLTLMIPPSADLALVGLQALLAELDIDLWSKWISDGSASLGLFRFGFFDLFIAPGLTFSHDRWVPMLIMLLTRRLR